MPCLQPQQLLGMVTCSITILVPCILAPGVTHHKTNGAIYGKYLFWKV